MRTSRAPVLLVLSLLLATFTGTGMAADSIWSAAAVDGSWASHSNWTAGVPDPTNTATFNNAGNGNTTIDLGAGGTAIRALTFDDVLSAPYTIGTGGAGSQVLTLTGTNGAEIRMAMDVGSDQVLDADVTSTGGYPIYNFSTNSRILTLNGTLATAGAQTLLVANGATINLNGTGNTATSTEVFGAGTVSANSIATNALNLQSGTLRLNSDQAIGTLRFNPGTAATSDATLWVGATNTVELGGTITYLPTPGVTNVALITNGVLRLPRIRDIFVQDNPLVSGPELTIQSDVTMPAGTFFNLQKGGPGTLRFVGNNSYNVLFILDGTVQILSDANLGIGDFELGGFGASDGTLEYVGAGGTIDNGLRVGQNFAAMTGAGAILANGSGPVTFTGDVHGQADANVTRTLVLGGSNTANNTFSGIIVDNNTASGGIVAFRKQGTGTWVLTGTNTYTGNTIVENGSLWIEGDSTGATGALQVQSGARIGGTGAWGGSLTCTNGAHIAWHLMGHGPRDGLDVSGDAQFYGGTALILRFNDSSSVDWSDTFWDAPHTWPLIECGGSLNGTSNLGLAVENWLDAQGQALQTVRQGSFFVLKRKGNALNLAYIPPGQGMSLFIR